MKKIEIFSELGKARLKIDGVDVSDIASEIVYTHCAGEIPTLTVKFLAPDLAFECDDGFLIPAKLPEPYNKFYIPKIERGSVKKSEK